MCEMATILVDIINIEDSIAATEVGRPLIARYTAVGVHKQHRDTYIHPTLNNAVRTMDGTNPPRGNIGRYFEFPRCIIGPLAMILLQKALCIQVRRALADRSVRQQPRIYRYHRHQNRFGETAKIQIEERTVKNESGNGLLATIIGIGKVARCNQATSGMRLDKYA